jgi:hypothetical protein
VCRVRRRGLLGHERDDALLTHSHDSIVLRSAHNVTLVRASNQAVALSPLEFRKTASETVDEAPATRLRTYGEEIPNRPELMMKPYVEIRRTHICAHVVVALAIAGAGCSRTTPTAPSISLTTDNAVASPAGQAFAATIDWGCLVGSGAGIFTAAAPTCSSSPMVPVARGRYTSAALPNASANLSASVSGGTVVLSWVAAAGPEPATSYVIDAGSSPGASNIASIDTGNIATSLTVTNVPPGTFFVRIRAKYSSGMGAPSNEVSFTVGGSSGCTGVPGAPSGLSSNISGSTLTLNWGASSGCPATTYAIEAGSSPGASNLANFSTGSSTTSFSAASVPDGTYFIRVRGGNASGFGTASNEILVSIGGVPPPVPW